MSLLAHHSTRVEIQAESGGASWLVNSKDGSISDWLFSLQLLLLFIYFYGAVACNLHMEGKQTTMSYILLSCFNEGAQGAKNHSPTKRIIDSQDTVAGCPGVSHATCLAQFPHPENKAPNCHCLS